MFFFLLALTLRAFEKSPMKPTDRMMNTWITEVFSGVNRLPTEPDLLQQIIRGMRKARGREIEEDEDEDKISE